MKTKSIDYPFQIRISFEKLFDVYRSHLESDNPILSQKAATILAVAKKYPILSKGLCTQAEINKYMPQINIVMEDMFTTALGKNEIKIATIPFQEMIIKSTERYNSIIAAAGKADAPNFGDFDPDESYIMACSIILNQHYGSRVDFRRPIFYKIPDANGIVHSYKMLYNADFMSISPTENSVDLTEEDIAQLIDNFDNLALWKKKFPPNSWIFEGFIIATMYDATHDVALSDFKTNLLENDAKDESFSEKFEMILRSLYNLNDIKVGFSLYNPEDDTFESPITNKDSYILNGEQIESCKTALCETSYNTLFKKQSFYSISDVDKFAHLYPKNVLYAKLKAQGIKSSIIVPVVANDQMYGVLEIVSDTPKALNSVNAIKLYDILPYLVESVKHTEQDRQNQIELMIQEECTSIHSSVHWKFKAEAQRVLRLQLRGAPAFFSEIVFQDVYPLYGQMDIKGSSGARNEATIKDLGLQLELVLSIIKKTNAIDSLPIYEQIEFRITEYLKDLSTGLQVNTEQHVLDFFRSEITPLFSHLNDKNEVLKESILDYYNQIDMTSGLIYKFRRDYDESVMLINKKMASLLDRKQREAQKMYPHYFERFKTDGVEHNMYIGESITKGDDFHEIYLYNLRLWQLQVMCEMENEFYKLKDTLPIPLDVASMILSFNSSLSLRFRMDEKRFDVDGTYNARYEVVKKRVDKANIKGTDERITQSGRIAIIYSQKEDENEYMKYVEFLQRKKLLDNDVELVEIEDLQGVTGLRALRVSVLYSKNHDDKNEYYTYEDLLNHIKS